MSLIDRLRKETQEHKSTPELEKILKDSGTTREDKHAARVVLNERNDR